MIIRLTLWSVAKRVHAPPRLVRERKRQQRTANPVAIGELDSRPREMQVSSRLLVELLLRFFTVALHFNNSTLHARINS